MRHKNNTTLFAYWDSVRAGRLAPQRLEIDPSRISALLPYTFILERIDAETFRFRLAGTRLCDLFGHELRGTNFLDGWEAIDRLPLLRQLSTLTRQGSVGVVYLSVAAVAEEPVECEVLLLPLRHTRDAIDRVLGSFAPLETSSWLGEKPIARKRVVTNEVIWPAADPSGAVSRMPPEQPVFATQPAARVVRSERRQFRVFDGGLSRTDPEEV